MFFKGFFFYIFSNGLTCEHGLYSQVGWSSQAPLRFACWKHKKNSKIYIWWNITYIYIYINTNIYIYIYISIPTYIYIKYTHAHQSSEFYSQSLISLTHFWIHRLGNARGGLAAHSAGASQSCGNAPWAGDRWNLVMWTMELGWNMVKHSGLIMNNGYLRHIHEYFLCNMIFHHIFALEQWILDPYDSIL